jgi:hypothetical protein
MMNLLLVCSDTTFKGFLTDGIRYYCKKQGMSFKEAWEMMFADASFEEVLNDRAEAIHCLEGLIESAYDLDDVAVV